MLRSVDKDMDAEALRLINTMPKWKPGRQKGQPVAVKFTVPVMFRLDDDKLEKTSSANGITVEGYAGNGKSHCILWMERGDAICHECIES